MQKELQQIPAPQTGAESAGYACQPRSLWPAGRPFTWKDVRLSSMIRPPDCFPRLPN